MSKIESVSLARFNNDEYYQYFFDLRALFGKYKKGMNLVEKYFPEFETSYADMDVAMRMETGSQKSKEVEAANDLRGKTWNACYTKVKATEKSPIVDEATSAKVLRRIFDQEGDVRTASINSESGTINKLITNLLLPENSNHLQTVGIGAWVLELKKQNEAFIVVLNERNLEKATKESNVKTVDARKRLDTIYQKIVDVINASVVMEMADESIFKFIAEVNAQIKYYKTSIASRSGRSGKSDDSDATKE